MLITFCKHLFRAQYVFCPSLQLDGGLEVGVGGAIVDHLVQGVGVLSELQSYTGLMGYCDCVNRRHKKDGSLRCAQTPPYLRLEEPVHPERVLAAVGLRKALLWHHSVLLHQVDHHVPLAAVAGGVVEQEGHEAAVGRLAGLAPRHLHHRVQEVVAPLNLFKKIEEIENYPGSQRQSEEF